MDELIGKKFRRNKYGVSHWSDKVVSVYLAWNFTIGSKYKTPSFIIYGTSGIPFELSEIVFE